MRVYQLIAVLSVDWIVSRASLNLSLSVILCRFNRTTAILLLPSVGDGTDDWLTFLLFQLRIWPIS